MHHQTIVSLPPSFSRAADRKMHPPTLGGEQHLSSFSSSLETPSSPFPSRLRTQIPCRGRDTMDALFPSFPLRPLRLPPPRRHLAQPFPSRPPSSFLFLLQDVINSFSPKRKKAGGGRRRQGSKTFSSSAPSSFLPFWRRVSRIQRGRPSIGRSAADSPFEGVCVCVGGWGPALRLFDIGGNERRRTNATREK